MSELIQRLKQQSAARKEQHRKVLSELGNHYDNLGKHFLVLKEEKDNSKAALNDNLTKMQSVMGDLTNKRIETGLPISSDKQQSFDEFLRESIHFVDKVSSGMNCYQEFSNYPDFSDCIVERMVKVQESSKEVKNKINSVEKTMDNTKVIIINTGNEDMSDESTN